jgi:hypothetical protein
MKQKPFREEFNLHLRWSWYTGEKPEASLHAFISGEINLYDDKGKCVETTYGVVLEEGT